MYTAALEGGANVRTGCTVTAVDPHKQEVTLESEEIVKCNVIVGADGPRGVCKEVVTGHPTQPASMGITFYKCVVFFVSHHR